MNLQTYYINAPKREFGQRSLTIQICQSVARESTVRIDYNDHGYNDHGYNEIAAITNEIEATFLVPKDRFTTEIFTVITHSRLTDIFLWSRKVRYNRV